MRVLWFTNVLMPELANVLGRTPDVSGGWMYALLDALRGREDIELGVATVLAGETAVSSHALDGVTYYCLPAADERASSLPRAFVVACDEVLREFEPDLVHVHGTEESYGRFTAQLQDGPPVVVSLQGLVHACAPFVSGGIRLSDAMEAGIAGGLSWLRSQVMQRRWRRRGKLEFAVLRGNRQFIGRTAWDRAGLLAVNPAANYHHADELLRPAFQRHRWDASAARSLSIFCTAAHSPMKGFHFVLDAVAMLRSEFPNVTVRVAAAPWDEARGYGYYGRYLRALIERRKLSANVAPLPPLDAETVARELAQAAVFVIPSLVENSPNSLAEAMMVGTPCVAALTGGIPSMIEDGTTALGFAPGNARALAACIRRIFRSASLAGSLSGAARSVAARRHDPARVVPTQLEIYRQVLAEDRRNPTRSARSGSSC